jgi:hypothetical protein
VCAYVSGAIGYWLLGYPDRALQSVEEGLALAEALGHPFTTAVSKWGATIIACLRGEILLAFEAAKDFATHSQEHGFSLYARVSGILQEIAESQSMGPRERKILAHKVYETASTNKGWPLWPWTFSQYLEACLAAGTARDGLQAVQRELDESPLAGQRLFISEVRRLYGELLLAEDEDLVPEAKEQFDLARAIARRQSARSLDLRVTMSLARLRRRQGRQMDAYRLLAESYSWFSEGFDTADLRAARKLLEELSEEST